MSKCSYASKVPHLAMAMLDRAGEVEHSKFVAKPEHFDNPCTLMWLVAVLMLLVLLSFDAYIHMDNVESIGENWWGSPPQTLIVRFFRSRL